MEWTKDETRSFASQKFPNCFDFFKPRILIGNHVVQAKHHNGSGVCQYPLVEQQLEPGLVDPLKHWVDVPCCLSNKLLKRRPRPEEQFQRSRDPLLKL